MIRPFSVRDLITMEFNYEIQGAKQLLFIYDQPLFPPFHTTPSSFVFITVVRSWINRRVRNLKIVLELPYPALLSVEASSIPVKVSSGKREVRGGGRNLNERERRSSRKCGRRGERRTERIALD